MNTNFNYFIDKGNDWNNDGHCDIEGWFVDDKGHHRPVIRKLGDYKSYKVLHRKYLPDDLDKRLVGKGKFGNVDLSPLYVYSLNDPSEELSSPNLNNYLRKNKNGNSKVEKRIREIDYLIKSFTVSQEINVYRGISVIDAPYIKELLGLKKGLYYYDDGFTSTSHSMETALRYGLEKSKSFIFMDITLSKGTHCMPLSKENKSSENEEFEILLKRKQVFRIDRVEKKYYNDKKDFILYIKMESVNYYDR